MASLSGIAWLVYLNFVLHCREVSLKLGMQLQDENLLQQACHQNILCYNSLDTTAASAAKMMLPIAREVKKSVI